MMTKPRVIGLKVAKDHCIEVFDAIARKLVFLGGRKK
jgi:hypothetical protein